MLPKIKELHHAGRLPASGVSQSHIEVHHNQWCVDNGYPIKKYRPQAGRPKRQASGSKLIERQAQGVKPQATGVKLQAASVKLMDP